MMALSKQQIERFTQELKALSQSDPTYQFLYDCVIGLQKEHIHQIRAKNQQSFQSYIHAEHILRRHTEYMAYRLGLQHGKEID